jgi:hypothetical protein
MSDSVVWSFIMCIGIVTALSLAAVAAERPLHSPDKKVIELDWVTPDAAYLAEHIREMEKFPFDGIALQAGAEDASMLDARPWGHDPVYCDVEGLAKVEWRRFRHNFLLCSPNLVDGFSWFDDRQWATILDNMRMLARAARAASGDGIMFDPETDRDRSPWPYARTGEGRPREEVEAKVRQRGREIIDAWQSEMPDVKVLSLWVFGYNIPTWDLLPAFFNGILDGLGPQAVLIDGDESSYYWASTNTWFDSGLHGEKYIKPENLEKWRTQVQLARSPYTDLIWGRYVWEGYEWKASLDDMRRRWEHNIYYGLATADEYIWCHSEMMAYWFRGANDNKRTDYDEPWSGVVEGLESAIAKYRAGERLGWDIIGPESANSDFTIDSSVVVNITSPTHRSSRRGPATITVEAEATGGEIERVEFYLNVEKVGDATAAPYRREMRDLPVGSYTFFARAFTTDGRHGTSGPATITVTGGRDGTGK